MTLIAFTIGFGTNKLANDRKDRNVATAYYCLRINTGNITRRNSSGSFVLSLCGNSRQILHWQRNVKKVMSTLQFARSETNVRLSQ